MNGAKATSGASSSVTSTVTKHDVRTTELNDRVLGQLFVDKSFGAPFVSERSSVTSICFDDRGETLISAGNDEKIQIFSLSSGRHGKTHYSKKYGVDLVRFTHRSSAIIHASTKLDHAIRHHSLHDNKYLRYFHGHQARVSALQMSPSDESFLSAAVNESVRLWDLRSANAQACMVINGHPIAAYDPSGQVFALAFNERSDVLLYDARKWTQKPFSMFTLGNAITGVITSLTFSPTGTTILIGTSGHAHYLVDAFDGTLLAILSGRTPLPDAETLLGVEEQEPQQRPNVQQAGTSGHECGWTPDAKYVFSGAGMNDVVFWSIPDISSLRAESSRSIMPNVQLTPSVGTTLRTVAFNPRSAMMATAGDQVALWLPDVPDDEQV